MKEPNAIFDTERAAAYDGQFASVLAINEALHLLTSFVLADLPAQARVLCVGAGTGAELLALARNHPGWHFTAVEPAPAMLEVCRRKAETHGLTARCTFHEGFLDSLPDAEPFDAATAFLVSHFLTQPQARRDFFAQIAARLRPGGMLVSSDLSCETADYEALLPVWLRMFAACGMTPDAEQVRASHRRDVAVLAPPEIAALLASSGFEAPTPFYQSLLIHAWFARRAANAAR